MLAIALIFGIGFTSPDAVKDRMLVMQAEAQLQFVQAQVEAKESVEKSAAEYVRILNQIASARDKAQQVLTEERLAQLLAAAEEARWNAAQSIIDQEKLRLIMLTARERAKYGSSITSRCSTVKTGVKKR